MRTVSTIARYLAGVIFLIFGLNGFLHFIPMPPPGGIAGHYMGALYASHYLWVIFAFQVVAAVLLLLNRYVPLAVAVLAPVIVNILCFHRFDGPKRAFAGPLRGGAMGFDIRPCATGVCCAVPIAVAGTGLTAGERNRNMAQELPRRGHGIHG